MIAQRELHHLLSVATTRRSDDAMKDRCEGRSLSFCRCVAPSLTRPAGLTIAELLIVMAILAVLISLVLIALSGVRSAGSRADSLNSLRQMVAGYNSYTSDNRQRLMPGFVHPNDIEGDVPLDARLQDGQYLDESADVGPYVWRLAPYVDHDWRIFFTDYRTAATVSALAQEYQDDQYGPGSHDENLGIAMMPAFGLNSIFLGGDTTHGGDEARSYNPLTGSGYGQDNERWAATRLAQVRNPANVIVFGPSGRARTGPVQQNELDIYQHGQFPHELGYFELRPPFVDRNADGVWSQQQWRVDSRYGEIQRTNEGEYSVNGGNYGAGLPIARWGANHYPVAHLDGSATTVQLESVGLDMRNWSPFAVGTIVPGFEPASN